jgi:peptide/nickel transport system permease protein
MVNKSESGTIVLKRLFADKTTVFGIAILLVLVVLAIFAPILSKYPYIKINPAQAFQGPSWEHPFGTDELGRDILSRIMYGGRYSLSVGVFSMVFSVFFGMLLGSIAGYFGGLLDNIIMRIMDILQSFPQLLLAIVIAAVLGPGLDKSIIALGVSGIPVFSRLIRASILSIRGMEYVEAATSINCSHSRIIIRHIIPNALSPIIVQASLSIAACILSAASLSYIGLGVQPPTPEWGAMLAAGRNYIRDYPYLVMIPGIFIMITVLSLNMVGDALRDALDPKLRN